MKSKVVWKGNMAFTGSNDQGFLIPLDAEKSVGGRDLGFRPLQLFAVGLCGCTGMDVISILKKKRQDVTAFEVSAELTRSEEHPKVFTNIVLHYEVTGNNIDEAAVERAVELSENKYCAAQAMLKEVAEITRRITINQL